MTSEAIVAAKVGTFRIDDAWLSCERSGAVGLTNAVTPIAVAKGKLLVGGQGVKGSRLLSIEQSSLGFNVNEIWHKSKINPFYCNWVQLPNDTRCVLGFMSKTLTAFDWNTGNIFWQKRDWTDCNLLCVDDQVLAARGEAYIGLLTCGSMESVEVRSDGRSISNRRHPISGPTTLNAKVQSWKKK